MNRVVPICLLLFLLLTCSGSIFLTTGSQLSTSFGSSSIYTTSSENIGETYLVIDDTKITAQYIDSESPVSLNINVTNQETSETITRSYNYSIDNSGEINLDESINLHEFDSSDFQDGQKTDLEIKFIVNHPDLESQITKKKVSVISNVNRQSCNTIKNSYADADSGVYKIEPTSGVTMNVYCEMNIDGGGWTLYHKTTDTSLPRLSGVNATPGLINVNDCDLTDERCNSDITKSYIQYNELMAYHPDSGAYFRMSGFNVDTFENEIQDTAGEISQNADAQSDVGTTSVVCNAQSSSGRVETTVDPMIVEVHHFGWYSENSVNHLWDGPSRPAGSGDKNDPAIGNRGKVIVCGGDEANVGNAYLMYR